MKSRKSRRFKLDYTTALIVSAAALFIISCVIMLSTLIRRSAKEKNDYKQPLVVKNLTYCNNEKLDLFVPQSNKSLPLVIYIHGGGWQYGSKVGGSLAFVKPLIQQDFAVASINYRLSSVAPFPAQINDVFCAVRYLRTHSAQYNINPEKISLVGISAGAHLAALAANSSENPEFTKGGYQDQSSKVQSVVGINGIYNLEASDLHKATKENLVKLLGKGKESAKSASPSSYVSSSTPQQLLIYSTSDSRVPPAQTTNYAKLLNNSSIEVKVIRVDNADHNLKPYFRLDTSPKKSELFNDIALFLRNS